MHQVMKGVRVLEVAQYTFVPSAGAVLADWGADVVKIESPGYFDAARRPGVGGGDYVSAACHFRNLVGAATRGSLSRAFCTNDGCGGRRAGRGGPRAPADG